MTPTQPDAIDLSTLVQNATDALLGSVGNILAVVFVVGMLLVAAPALRGLLSSR